MKSQYEQLLLRRRPKAVHLKWPIIQMACSICFATLWVCLFLSAHLQACLLPQVLSIFKHQCEPRLRSSSESFRQRTKEFGIYNQPLTVWLSSIENEWRR